MGCGGGVSGVNHFALVSYIPGRLAVFLDNLRAELKPGCVLRAHVTVLPPRPLHLDVAGTIRSLAAESRESQPFHVELGEVSIFEKSNVVYLSLSGGEQKLHALHENLNSGQLEYDGPFPYHPHITLAQDLTYDEALACAQIARMRWAGWDGPREFSVDELAFVRSDKPGIWRDLAHLELGQPVGSH
jgi:2'-5' RNA ligase